MPGDGAGIVGASASAEAPRVAPRCDARTLSDRAIWQQRDLDWENLVDEARRLGPDPALTTVPDAELEQDLCGVASQLAALTARWLELLCELVVRGIWADQGARTPAQWLSWRVGVAPSTAREHVRIALRLRELPRIRAAFAAGELSYSKVRAMTRIAVREIEEMVLTWAGVSTAAQLERIAADFRLTRRGALGWQEGVAGRRTSRDPDADDPRHRWSRRTLPDGTMEIRVRCPVEEGAELCAALDRRLDAQAEDDATASSDPTRGPETTVEAGQQARPAVVSEPRSSLPGGRAAARVRELLSLVVAAEDRPVDTSGLDRHTLVLHAPVEELAGQDVPGPVPVDDDHGRMRSMSRSTLRPLACEAGLVLVATDDRGSPIDLGRRDRRLSAALRRALRLRDRTCRFPGCHATRHSRPVTGQSSAHTTWICASLARSATSSCPCCTRRSPAWLPTWRPPPDGGLAVRVGRGARARTTDRAEMQPRAVSRPPRRSLAGSRFRGSAAGLGCVRPGVEADDGGTSVATGW